MSFDTATSRGVLLVVPVVVVLLLVVAAATRDVTADRFDSSVAVLAGDGEGTAMSAILVWSGLVCSG